RLEVLQPAEQVDALRLGQARCGAVVAIRPLGERERRIESLQQVTDGRDLRAAHGYGGPDSARDNGLLRARRTGRTGWVRTGESVVVEHAPTVEPGTDIRPT